MKKFVMFLLVASLITGCATGGLPTMTQLENEYFGECPPDYKQRIMADISENLVDPQSAIFRFSEPTKYVSGGKFGHTFIVGINAKNRFGGYVGEERHKYMCFADGSIQEIDAFSMGLSQGLGNR